MKNLLKLLSFLGLVLTIVPSFLVFYRVISLDTHYTLMAVGMVVWFISAPLWLGKKTVMNE
jgi:hypothetical protein